ncbi:MAG: LysR family transcriptional regulator [Clostridiales Family XIII bacterium]|jgi:DNA-binding transcriptional LysR family regulator|nr:LysR family transcriptional regulator [Clostridiales Family XIII bacterium]
MEMRQIHCFITVAERLSFTDAAKKLHIVQSAVSHNIAELEKELQTKLFVRNKQSITLTPQGLALLDDAYRIVAMERDAVTRVLHMARGIVGDLKLGYVFVPVIHPMMDKFKNFSKKYPQIYVSYNSYTDIHIARQVENGDLDIGFAREATVNRDRAHWRPLYGDALKIVVHREHPLAGLGCTDLERFRKEPLILMNRRSNPGLYDMSMHLYAIAGFTPRVIDDINDERTVNMLVEIGMGMTILPECWREFVSPSLKFLDIDCEDANHVFGVSWNKTNTNPCARLFLAELGVAPPE